MVERLQQATNREARNRDALDGGDDGIAVLVPDQQLDVVLPGEAGDEAGFVFVDSPDEVAGNANVQCAAFTAG